MRRKEIKMCSVPECQRQSAARGYCSSHYEQWKRGKTPPELFTPLPPRPECLVSGCDRPQYCRGGCRTHYDSALRFNLSLLQLIQVYAAGCGICGARENLHIDHNHSCCDGPTSCGDCVRGGLCESCNMAVGALGDDVEGVMRAVDYLLGRRW